MSDALSSRLQTQLVLSGTGPSSESLDDFNNVIVEILSWLPVKSLLRFKSVCKAWHALISESYFIKKHLSRINTKLSTSYSFLNKDDEFCRSVEYEAIFKCSSHGGPLPTRRIDFPIFPVLGPLIDFNDLDIVGSCNGLLCLEDNLLNLEDVAVESLDILLWNPCTGKSQVLPQPPIHSKSHQFKGFGYDSSSDDYKVVLGNCECDERFVVVFSLKRGSWRELERINSHFKVGGNGVLVNETLHWVLEEAVVGGFVPTKIVSFDLGEEKFHEIPFPYPPKPVDNKPGLIAEVGMLNNCLTLHFQTMYCLPPSELKMWVMKEYGVKESWAQVIHISSEVVNEEYVCKACISENGQVLILLFETDSLALYNPYEKTFRIVMEGGYEVATYIETLVSPLIGSTDASM